MATVALKIEGMHCGACVRRVTQTLNALPSTHADEVAIGSARITSSAPVGEITGALELAGFPAQAVLDKP